jgi:hypothetical protein
MRILPVIAFLALMAACKTPQPIIVQAPPPPRIVRPVLRVHSLPPTATVTEVLKAYVLDLTEQSGYADQLETLIWGPTPQEPKP